MRKTLVNQFLPYGRHNVDAADIAAVSDVLRGDFLTTGPSVRSFEAKFAEATGARHAVSCSSGTAALHLAALALGLGPDMTVIVPTLTFLATANAARYVGAEVCFADVDADTGLMSADGLKQAIDSARAQGMPPVRAVFPVHLNGQCCNLPEIAEITAAAGIKIVEDACHALGQKDIGACDHSDMAAFSLHPVKAIAAGEGGIVTTKNADYAEKLFRFRNHGMTYEPDAFRYPDQAFDPHGTVNPWYYEMAELGFNYRLSDIHAALGESQLGRLEDFVLRRRDLVDRYDQLLVGHEPEICPIRRTRGQKPAWHLYVVLIDFVSIGKSRANVMTELREVGIGSQVHYLPVHRQPYYRDRYGHQSLVGADAYYDRALSLPLFPEMTEADVERVVRDLLRVMH